MQNKFDTKFENTQSEWSWVWEWDDRVEQNTSIGLENMQKPERLS